MWLVGIEERKGAELFEGGAGHPLLTASWPVRGLTIDFLIRIESVFGLRTSENQLLLSLRLFLGTEATFGAVLCLGPCRPLQLSSA